MRRAVPEAAHEEALTRPEITASVHYLRFTLDPAQVDRFATGPVALAVDHPEYDAETVLARRVRAELLTDLDGNPATLPPALLWPIGSVQRPGTAAPREPCGVPGRGVLYTVGIRAPYWHVPLISLRGDYCPCSQGQSAENTPQTRKDERTECLRK